MNIIEAKNIGKKYKITHQKGGYVALRDVLTNIFKNPFAFLKTKAKEITGFETKENFWALKDIDFEIKQGEIVGIIGRNGAGKSTLLKILSQITPPTTGEIIIKGKVGSLLEVGTGFHPELTGRENIFLNGAILGMTKKEIVRKFDDIVKFADIEKFIDTPVKYYSSGMYVRLAFSVAAHMEPDILIVDEVLAVGDAEFQRKCLGKMEEITKKEGRTILFVSHNMDAIRQLCDKCIWISKGQVKMISKTNDVINAYLTAKPESRETEDTQNINQNVMKSSGTRFTNVEISNLNGDRVLRSSDKLKVVLKYESDREEEIINPRVVITVTSESSKNIVLRLDSNVTEKGLLEKIKSSGNITCQTTESIDLIDGAYLVDVDFLIDGVSVSYLQGIRKFEVETDLKNYGYKNFPDKNVCDTVIKYEFTEK
jgi:lipopolysaccharide transport system ATP-binding protein